MDADMDTGSMFQLDRYSRQIRIPGFGTDGQKRMSAASVMILSSRWRRRRRCNPACPGRHRKTHSCARRLDSPGVSESDAPGCTRRCRQGLHGSLSRKASGN
jgi:hypothetical protein